MITQLRDLWWGLQSRMCSLHFHPWRFSFSDFSFSIIQINCVIHTITISTHYNINFSSFCPFPNFSTFFFQFWDQEILRNPLWSQRTMWLEIISLQETCVRLRIFKFLFIIHGYVTVQYIHADPHAVTNMWKSENIFFVQSIVISHFYLGS